MVLAGSPSTRTREEAWPSRNKSLRHGDEGKNVVCADINQIWTNSGSRFYTLFLSPSRYREQLGRAQGLHPTSIPPKVEPRNKNEDPETVHRVAFKRNSCPSIDTGKPDREREPDGRKGKFVLLGSPLTSFDILVEKL